MIFAISVLANIDWCLYLMSMQRLNDLDLFYFAQVIGITSTSILGIMLYDPNDESKGIAQSLMFGVQLPVLMITYILRRLRAAVLAAGLDS